MTLDRDIVDVLVDEHIEIRRLFDEVEHARGTEREDRFRHLVAQLAGHEAAEEALVHPVLRDDVPGGAAVAAQILDEESSAERLLAELTHQDLSSPEFETGLRRLRSEVVTHAEHEEREEFTRLRDHVSADTRADLGRRYERVKAAGPTRPHPHTPQTPEIRALLGPIVGLFDRVRDSIRDALRAVG
jgi:hemerythrin superfamily protein